MFIIFKTGIVFGQTLEIKEIITDNYPEVKVKFVVKDQYGNEIRTPALSDVKVTERDILRSVKLFCEPPGSKFSLIFTLDRSASMMERIDSIRTRWDLVRYSCKNTINALPGDINRWECAITSFSRTNGIQSHFSNNKKALIDTLSVILLQGGDTDFNSGFLWDCLSNPGAVLLARDARYKPIIFFITDGEHNTIPIKCTPLDPDIRSNVWTSTIINNCKNYNVTVYGFTLGFPPPQSLTDICQATGGAIYMNDFNQSELDSLIRSILSNIDTMKYISPCEVTWTTDCIGGTYIKFEVPQFGLSLDTSYTIPDNVKPYLEVLSKNIVFDFDKPGNTFNKNIVITSKNNTSDITGIRISNPKFTVIDWGGPPPPFNLNKAKSRDFVLQFSPSDTQQVKAVVSFTGSFCASDSVFLTTNYIAPDTSKPYLEIIPRNVNFPQIKQGMTVEKNLNVTVRKKDVIINGATVSDYRFSIIRWTGKSLPFTVQRDSSFDLVLKYVSDNPGTVNDTLNFSCGGCDSSYAFLTVTTISGMGEPFDYSSSKIVIGPNPASDFIRINLPNTNKIYKISVYSISGEDIYHRNFNETSERQDLKIPVNDFSNGFYYMKVTDGINTNYYPLIIRR